MKPAIYHPEAQTELTESAFYYEQRRPNLGIRFLIAVEACEQIISARPAIGSPFELGSRRFLVKGFPYQLIYKEYDDHLFIFAVAHCSRKPGFWKARI